MLYRNGQDCRRPRMRQVAVSMAKKLSSILFSTIRRAARIQRRALKQVVAPAIKKSRKPARKKAAKRTAPRRSTSSDAAKIGPIGKGIWQECSHRPVSGHTAFLGRLTYSLYRPKDMPIAGMPLVIMLHGCQQTPYDMALGTRMYRLADTKGFVVAYPRQEKRIQPMRCWRWFQPDAGHGLAEADAIASVTRAIVRKYRLDATRVYVAGLSAGAGMAGLTALRHPDIFAAAALHSGAVIGASHSAASGLHVMRRGSAGDPVEQVKTLVSGEQLPAGMPAMILHGQRDRIVSIRNAIQLAQQFSYVNGASTPKKAVLGQGTHREYERHDFLKGGQVMVRLCLLKEVGHAWSGGNSTLKFHSEKGPGASVLMWQFFSMHRRLSSD